MHVWMRLLELTLLQNRDSLDDGIRHRLYQQMVDPFCALQPISQLKEILKSNVHHSSPLLIVSSQCSNSGFSCPRCSYRLVDDYGPLALDLPIGLSRSRTRTAYNSELACQPLSFLNALPPQGISLSGFQASASQPHPSRRPNPSTLASILFPSLATFKIYTFLYDNSLTKKDMPRQNVFVIFKWMGSFFGLCFYRLFQHDDFLS